MSGESTMRIGLTGARSARYASTDMTTTAIPPLTQDELVRFYWAPLDRSTECWTWSGPRSTRKGSGKDYGVFRVKRDGRWIVLKAHRLVLALTLGYEPDMACHHCDNPPCIRPSHLYAGTAKSNSDDAIERGRRKNYLGSRRPDVTRLHAGRIHDEGGQTAIETSDDIESSRWIDELDALDDLSLFIDRIGHGGRLPEVIA